MAFKVFVGTLPNSKRIFGDLVASIQMIGTVENYTAASVTGSLPKICTYGTYWLGEDLKKHHGLTMPDGTHFGVSMYDDGDINVFVQLGTHYDDPVKVIAAICERIIYDDVYLSAKDQLLSMNFHP